MCFSMKLDQTTARKRKQLGETLWSCNLLSNHRATQCRISRLSAGAVPVSVPLLSPPWVSSAGRRQGVVEAEPCVAPHPPGIHGHNDPLPLSPQPALLTSSTPCRIGPDSSPVHHRRDV